MLHLSAAGDVVHRVYGCRGIGYGCDFERIDSRVIKIRGARYGESKGIPRGSLRNTRRGKGDGHSGELKYIGPPTIEGSRRDRHGAGILSGRTVCLKSYHAAHLGWIGAVDDVCDLVSCSLDRFGCSE